MSQGSPVNEKGNLVDALAFSDERDMADYRSWKLETPLCFTRLERDAGYRLRAARRPARDGRAAEQSIYIARVGSYPCARARIAPMGR